MCINFVHRRTPLTTTPRANLVVRQSLPFPSDTECSGSLCDSWACWLWSGIVCCTFLNWHSSVLRCNCGSDVVVVDAFLSYMALFYRRLHYFVALMNVHICRIMHDLLICIDMQYTDYCYSVCRLCWISYINDNNAVCWRSYFCRHL